MSACSLIVAALLGGCTYNASQAPVATTYPYSEQQRMQAAHHWEVLAQYEVERMMRRERLRNLPLYVVGDNDSREFQRNYRTLLTSHLVSRGAQVATVPGLGGEVHVDVNVIRHRDRGFVRPRHGSITTLAAGVRVAAFTLEQWSDPTLTLLPLAVAADVFSGGWTHTGNEEVVITTQVINNQQILYSSSHIYYINAGDIGHYMVPPAPPAPPSISLSNEW
ncbi:hypothetical protein HIO72_11630 [Halomonas sp. PA5]|nr:hypothetical protein HIO72_11630 [Halomonas sp. PA5]